MNSLSTIINVISQAISIRLMRTLSQQIESSRHGHSAEPSGFLGTLLQRVTGIPARQTFADRIDSDKFERRAKKRLLKSSTQTASMQQAHDEAVRKYDQATNAVQNAAANPQGHNLQALIDEADKYAAELKVAQASLKKATEAHDKLTADIDAERKLQPKATGSRHKTFFERFMPGPSDSNRDRLQSSLESHQSALKDQSKAEKAVAAAQKEFDDEKLKPTGKDLAKLKDAVDALQKAFAAATQTVHKSADSHQKLEKEVARQTKWQGDRSRSSWTHPGQYLSKAKQSLRIAQRQFQRFQQARSKSGVAKGAFQAASHLHQIAQAAHNTARQRFRNAMALMRAGKGTRAQAIQAANVMWITGQKLAAAQGAKATAGVAAQAARRLATIAGARALVGGARVAAAGGEVGLAAAAAAALVAVTVGKVKSWVDQQLAKGEQRVQGLLTNRAQYSGALSGAIAQYQTQDWRLNRMTAQQTSSSAVGVVKSTMALKEAQQPQNAAWEDITNKLTAAGIDTATMLQKIINEIDFVTPMVATMVDYLSQLPWIRKNTDKGGEVNQGIEAFRTLSTINNQFRNQKAFPPLPPIKRK